MALAKALYDNLAESVDEIAFRKGDILNVVEQDTGGLDGWWLVSLRGKQGIAPGNRLKMISGMRDSPSPYGSNSSLNTSHHSNHSANISINSKVSLLPGTCWWNIVVLHVYYLVPVDRSFAW